MPSPRPATGALARLLLAAIGLAAVACMVQPLVELPARIGRNQNEGWNAFHAQAFVEGTALYPAPTELVSNNYPPLSYLVVGTLSGDSGDVLITGRVVAFVALLVVVACVGWIGTKVTGSGFLGVFAALLVLGTMGGHYQNYVGLNDPQMLGHALQFLGLALFVGRGERRWAVVLSVLLLVAGGLAKHNLLPVPAGILVWLFLERRPHRLLWIVVAVLATMVSLALSAFAFGPHFLPSTLVHPRDYDPYYMLRGLQSWFVPVAPLLVGAMVVILLPVRDRAVRLMLCIAWAALGFGLLSSLGQGMNYNALFDLVFVAAVLCGVAVGELSSRAGDVGREKVMAAALLACASSFLLVTPMKAYQAREALEERQRLRHIAAEDIAFVASQPGPVICEDPSVAFWSGKSFDVDLFNLSQKVAAGAIDEAVIAQRIAGGELAVIQVVRRDTSPFLTEATNELFREHYRLARHSEVNGYLYVPRDRDGG